MTQKNNNIAIIGAGISGLVLASNLVAHGYYVTLFEKSRGGSGRTSTRYADTYEFDHGSPYFTTRTPEFKAFASDMLAKNVISQWQPKINTIAIDSKPFKSAWFEPHYVGYGRMNNLAKYLLSEISDKITLHLGTEISKIENKNQITLIDKKEQSYNGFDRLVITAPAPQAYNLLPNDVPYREKIKSVEMSPAYCVMIGLKKPLKTETGLYICKDEMIDKIIINSDKPERPQSATSLVVISNPDWALAHVDEDVPQMQEILWQRIQELLNTETLVPEYMTTHRWRYAKTKTPLDQSFVWDQDSWIGICADWCQDEASQELRVQGVEAAFLSATKLSEILIDKC